MPYTKFDYNSPTYSTSLENLAFLCHSLMILLYLLPTPGILRMLSWLSRASSARFPWQVMKRKNHRLEALLVMAKSSGQTAWRSACIRLSTLIFSLTSSLRLLVRRFSFSFSKGVDSTFCSTFLAMGNWSLRWNNSRIFLASKRSVLAAPGKICLNLASFRLLTLYRVYPRS